MVTIYLRSVQASQLQIVPLGVVGSELLPEEDHDTTGSKEDRLGLSSFKSSSL